MLGLPSPALRTVFWIGLGLVAASFFKIGINAILVAAAVLNVEEHAGAEDEGPGGGLDQRPVGPDRQLAVEDVPPLGLVAVPVQGFLVRLAGAEPCALGPGFSG